MNLLVEGAEDTIPVRFRPVCKDNLNKAISNIPPALYLELQKRIDASLQGDQNTVRELAAVVTKSSWQEHDIADMLRDKSPGDKLLYRLGNLNKTLHDVIIDMKKIHFWSGLEVFLEKFGTIKVLDISKSVQLRRGQDLMLKCLAAGVPAPKYQWFRKQPTEWECLTGQTTPTLRLQQGSVSDGDIFVCTMGNVVKGDVYTSACTVTLPSVAPTVAPPVQHSSYPDYPQSIESMSLTNIPPSPSSRPSMKSYYARDKVALLIGNGKHLSEAKLQAPPNDIVRLGKKLRKMKFKTLICKDLNKADMNNVINFFVNLLNEGVYGVLYFAGHGFETRERECYLVPSDAPVSSETGDCVSARGIHAKMLEKSPALCLLILDICRSKKSPMHNAVKPHEPHGRHKTNNTTMLVYATNEGAKAWEMKENGEHVSVFCIHLLRCIDEKISVKELMYNRVLNSMADDKLAMKQMQSPEIQSTLAKDLSLHDPIDHRGFTKEFETLMHQWEKVSRLPRLKTTMIEELGIEVRRYCDQIYSNSLIIYLVCMRNDEKAEKAMAHVTNIDNVSVTGSAELLERATEWPKHFAFGTDKVNVMSVSKNVIDGLETLRDDLRISIKVLGNTRHSESKFETQFREKLGKPLLACLHHDCSYEMKGKTVVLIKKVPQEHEEETAVQHDESMVAGGLYNSQLPAHLDDYQSTYPSNAAAGASFNTLPTESP